MKERLCLEVERFNLSVVITGNRGFGVWGLEEDKQGEAWQRQRLLHLPLCVSSCWPFLHHLKVLVDNVEKMMSSQSSAHLKQLQLSEKYVVGGVRRIRHCRHKERMRNLASHDLVSREGAAAVSSAQVMAAMVREK
ncbi:hypothetical protein ZIOFF_029125 [Zingiber officinale]|uniref:Uncharacterized protein n=1 Tax=Zingiber officinale TaxID=94328 RepID=A0A8J5GT78_ZINOF|nr:hypothetical protein ZIOFF_029125 [Zingiber officinale]